MNPVAEQKVDQKIEVSVETKVYSPIEIQSLGNSPTMMEVVKRSD